MDYASKIDQERQIQAREYARLKHRVYFLELGVLFIGLIFVLASGLSVWLRDLALSITPDPILSTLLYAVVGIVAYSLLFLPVSLYSGYLLPHRYDMSNQNFLDWLWDMVKVGILMLVFMVAVIEVMYFLLRTTPEWWWLISAGLLILVAVALTALTPIVILPIFIRFEPLTDPELVERLMRLAANANTRVNGVYTMIMSDRTSAANAAFMGLGRSKRIVLGDTLYATFTPDEIETIIAHELAHQVNNDIVRGIVVQSAILLAVFFVANFVMQAGIAFFGFDGIADLAGMPLLMLALSAASFFTQPLANAYSRRREELADRYALEATRNPEAFISAFEKLANQNLAETEPEPWVEIWLSSHPSIAKRVAMGNAFRTLA